MLRHVLFDLSLFMDESDRKNSQKRVLWLLEALTRCDQLYLQLNPDTPLLYQSGVVYKIPEQFKKSDVPEVALVTDYLKEAQAPKSVQKAMRSISMMCGGGEVFRDVARIIENGGGDCDNLACWRAAELRNIGIPANPFITWRERADGGMTYHVIVQWPDNVDENERSSEDPSLLLGMGGEGRARDRAEEERKLGERLGNFISALSVKKRAETILGAARPGTQRWDREFDKQLRRRAAL